MKKLLCYSLFALIGIFTVNSCGSTNAPTKYQVTISAEPAEGGSVSPNSGKYKAGTELHLKATPSSNKWRFDHWSGDFSGTNPTGTVTVKSDIHIIAHFAEKQYKLTVNIQGQGTVEQKVIEKAASTTKKYEAGTTVQLTAKPANGWSFVKWAGDLTGSKNPATITIKSPKEVTAVFKYTSNTFHLAPNGVTVVCTDAEIGDVGVVNGHTYTKRLVSRITPDNASTTCTSGITDMSSLFKGATDFNGDISSWDVSMVTTMAYMFKKAESFNQSIGIWDVGNVTNMSFMFAGDVSFNQPIGSWNVSNVTNMRAMFNGAKSFNQPIGNWKVSNVVDMSYMFKKAESFNKPIGSWNVGDVISMKAMFRGAKSFNQPIGNWNVRDVDKMAYMFYKAKSFNQDISGWCVSKIPTKPTNFAVGSSLTQAHMPNWGTCSTQINGIDGMRLIQSTQNPDHTVPMVAGRDAALRVFFKIDALYDRYSYPGPTAYDKKSSSGFNYDVTVKLYNHGMMIKKLFYPAGTKMLHLLIKRHVYVLNIIIPGRYIQPGLSVKVTTSNGWHYDLNSITVKKVAEFHISLIPIRVPMSHETGNVNEHNKGSYMEAALDMYPINDYIVKVHSQLTVDADSGHVYTAALGEVEVTWIAEGKPDYYYYGVLPEVYGKAAGIAGCLGGCRTAVGYDRLGWEHRSEAMAHELGHTMGRRHAPCGNPAGPDPNYPYQNASIGVYGYEVDKGELKDPAIYHDLMSYCYPSWISDYTYKAVFQYREKENSNTSANQSPQDVLLVWGRITNNKLTLEPAFRIKAPVTMPQKSGPYTLSGYDKNGNQLFSFSFAGSRIPDLKNTRLFTFAIPTRRVDINRLHTIRLSGRSLKAMQQTNTSPQIAQMNTKPQVAARRVSRNTVSIRWNNPQYQMALVKNPRTGEVIGFMSGGGADIKSNASRLKIYFSDGVRTVTKIVTVR